MSMIPGTKNFYKLVEAINTYDLDIYKNGSYNTCSIYQDNIVAIFYSVSYYTDDSGKIRIDNYENSDVWKNSALSLPLPENDYQIDFIIKQLKFWETRKGARIRKNKIFSKYVRNYLPYIYGLR